MSRAAKNVWDPKTYKSIDDDLKSAGIDPFATSKRTLSSAADMDDRINPAVGGVRKCRDLEDGTRKTPISVYIDVTGSGNHVPGVVRDNLPAFVGLMIQQGYVTHPDVQYGFFGDAYSDGYPLQVGQFESSAEKIDEVLRLAVLEGGGGGQQRETYELAIWFATYRNELDCWKRGEKGHLFLIGDEMAYPEVSMRHINTHINPEEKVSRDVDTKELISETMKKYHITYIICEGSSYYNDPKVLNSWKALIGGENVVRLKDPRDISALMAGLVGVRSGISVDRVESDIKALGSVVGMDNITTALTVASQGAIDKPRAGSNKVTRI